jgi:hypothetical protein
LLAAVALVVAAAAAAAAAGMLLLLAAPAPRPTALPAASAAAERVDYTFTASTQLLLHMALAVHLLHWQAGGQLLRVCSQLLRQAAATADNR